MISNQILQSTLDGIKAISDVDFIVTDADANELCSTCDEYDKYRQTIFDFSKSEASSQEFSGYSLFRVEDENQPEYLLAVIGTGEDTHTVGRLAAFQLGSLVMAYRDKFDRDSFIKNLLLDNLLLVDIYGRAKKLHIRMDEKRVVMIIEPSEGKDPNLLESVMASFPTGGKDFVTSVDENSVVVVKEIIDEDSEADIEKTAGMIRNNLERDNIKKVRISYGNQVTDLKEVSRSYKEAKMAMDVGRIFFEDRFLVAYDELGIGRLIYQLPLPLCRMFINEIFGGKSPDEFDEETITTIHKFFENSLNVSETSRQLFIHRNTLVYRLDKLEKSTGLDLRVFEDAITFKIALMVVKYMKYMENQ